jgi:hypothetical protein
MSHQIQQQHKFERELLHLLMRIAVAVEKLAASVQPKPKQVPTYLDLRASAPQEEQ